MVNMNRQQAEILESIAALPDDERRELLDRLFSAMPAAAFLDRMSPAQRADLDTGLLQVETGEVVGSDELKERIRVRFGFAGR